VTIVLGGVLAVHSEIPLQKHVGPLADGGFLLNSGWVLRPAGTQVPVDTFPMSQAASADGRYLVVLNGGYNPPSLSVIDVAQKKEVGRTPLPDAWLGLTMRPDNVLYVGGGTAGMVYEFALDAASGRERWIFDPKVKRDVTYGDFASRGVSAWLDPRAHEGTACRRRIFVATAQSQLYALDARSGRPCKQFGSGGMVDLKRGLRIPPFETQAYSITSPPLVMNGLVISGSSIADNSRLWSMKSKYCRLSHSTAQTLPLMKAVRMVSKACVAVRFGRYP